MARSRHGCCIAPAGQQGRRRSLCVRRGWDLPDGIDVFRASGAGLSFFSTSRRGAPPAACGSHYLAVVTDPADCLVHSDAGDQQIDSFAIDPSTGQLGSMPVSSVDVGGEPGDLAVSGSMVFASSGGAGPGFYIDVLTVGAGCSLTLDSVNPDEGDEYTYDIAVANPTTVISCDAEHGQMLAYTLQSNDTLVQTVASPDKICGGAGMVTTNVGTHTLAFTGGGTALGIELEGFNFDGSAFTSLPGSPQKVEDQYAEATAVGLSLPNRLLVQSAAGPLADSQLSWDTLAGGVMRYYGGHTALPDSPVPIELTVAGNVILVADNSANLVACSLAPSGVSDCRVVATLTAPDPGHSNSGSTAIF